MQEERTRLIHSFPGNMEGRTGAQLGHEDIHDFSFIAISRSIHRERVIN
jgi:hypothetical protein